LHSFFLVVCVRLFLSTRNPIELQILTPIQ
jgi:hypothetical protein